MKAVPHLRCAIALALLGLISGCEQLETAQQTATRTVQAVMTAPSGGHWAAEGVRGSPRIVVHLSEQRAYFYKGKRLVGESTVSTGKPGFSTPPGRYTVLQKDRDHVSSLYGDYIDDEGNVVQANIDVNKDLRPPNTHFDGAKMPYFMRFRSGYGMHAGYVPPYRASHGCIRLPEGMARRFYTAANVGTPVIVKE